MDKSRTGVIADTALPETNGNLTQFFRGKTRDPNVRGVAFHMQALARHAVAALAQQLVGLG